MQEVRRILAMAGMEMDQLVSLQVFCSDVSLWERFNAVYRTYFKGRLLREPFSVRGRCCMGLDLNCRGLPSRTSCRDMKSLAHSLREGRWGLARARQLAREIEGDKRAVKVLVGAMFDDEPELRKRAADVARRITERDAVHRNGMRRRPCWSVGLGVRGGVADAMAPRDGGCASSAYAQQRLRAARLM